MNLKEISTNLRKAQSQLALCSATDKNKALLAVKNSLDKNRSVIMEANKIDVEKARQAGTPESLVDRLSLNDAKINGILESIDTIISQTDPCGVVTDGWSTPNGLAIRQVRVPIGVISIIYESRPNVTVDAFALAYKSANAILLRGSSSANESNKAIVKAIKEGLDSKDSDGKPAGFSGAVELAPCQSHEEVNEILTATGLIDCAIPRGSARLIKSVVENARIPVIETGAGICHLYVDASADLSMAAKIAENAKIQRPGVCNAIEAVLVNKEVLGQFLPMMSDIFAGRVTMFADEKCYAILEQIPSAKGHLEHAAAEHEGFEFLDYKCLVKAIDDTESAIEYINSHNTKHSESIITKSLDNAKLFQAKVDAACVYVNASTRFTDGGEFGFGAEVGISTQKLHARGPMGIMALTTTKYLIDGEGQTR